MYLLIRVSAMKDSKTVTQQLHRRQRGSKEVVGVWGYTLLRADGVSYSCSRRSWHNGMCEVACIRWAGTSLGTAREPVSLWKLSSPQPAQTRAHTAVDSSPHPVDWHLQKASHWQAERTWGWLALRSKRNGEGKGEPNSSASRAMQNWLRCWVLPPYLPAFSGFEFPVYFWACHCRWPYSELNVIPQPSVPFWDGFPTILNATNLIDPCPLPASLLRLPLNLFFSLPFDFYNVRTKELKEPYFPANVHNYTVWLGEMIRKKCLPLSSNWNSSLQNKTKQNKTLS